MTATGRLVRIGVIAAGIISVASCSRPMVVKPAGQIDQGVDFVFYEMSGGPKPSKFRIVQFVVQEKESETQWRTVWELTGARSLDAIRYAEKYEGLTEGTPARPLSRQSTYRVSAKAEPQSGPISYATAVFSFDEKGAVVVTGPS